LRESYPDVQTTIATREEEAFGIAAGSYLGGKRPTVMLQSSGLGNSINALTSLFVPYQIPALILISMRGDEGEWNSAQVPMGRAVRPFAMRSVCRSHGDSPRPPPTRSRWWEDAFMTRMAGVCLLPRRLTVPAPPVRSAHDEQHADDAARGDPADCSRSAAIRSWRASAIRPTTCSPPATATRTSIPGAAWASPRPSARPRHGAAGRRIVVLDGDGSLLMNLGSLATIGWVRPRISS
jgi:hypothetical protein